MLRLLAWLFDGAGIALYRAQTLEFAGRSELARVECGNTYRTRSRFHLSLQGPIGSHRATITVQMVPEPTRRGTRGSGLRTWPRGCIPLPDLPRGDGVKGRRTLLARTGGRAPRGSGINSSQGGPTISGRSPCPVMTERSPNGVSYCFEHLLRSSRAYDGDEVGPP